MNENTKISVKTSVGESKTAPIKDSVGQGSFAAALVSSLNIGSAIADKFKGESSANIGLLELICLILQDDIMKMSNTLEQARNGSEKIECYICMRKDYDHLREGEVESNESNVRIVAFF